jgi:hypothetical protein
MPASQQTGSSLHVDHIRAQYLIASDHPAPQSVKQRLDDALSKNLADSLRVALSSWFSDDDPSIWFVRQLDVNLDLNLDWNPEQVGKTWATQLVRKLSRDLKEDSAHGIIRFPNRAAYLASFLRDLATGDAWSKWYYTSFDGLRMLPVSAAIATAIRNDVETSLPALLQLSTKDLIKVLDALSTQGARRVLDAIAEQRPALDESRCFVELWNIWKRDESELLYTSNELSGALRLYLEVERREHAGGPTLQRAALALVRLVMCLNSGSRNENVLRALLNGDIAELYVAAGAEDAEVLLPFTHCPTELLQEIWTTVSATPDPTSYERASDKAYTSFGGVFILLPLLDRLPLDELTEGWPDVDQQRAVSLARFIVLVKCMGRERFNRAWNDPLLRELLQIGPRISTDLMNDWSRISRRAIESFLQRLTAWDRENYPLEHTLFVVTKLNDDLEYLTSPAFTSADFNLALSVAAQRVMRQFAWRLPGFSRSSLPYLYTNFLDFRASVAPEPDRHVVRVGTPPLNIILAITGLQRASFNLSWLEDARPFKLFQTE